MKVSVLLSSIGDYIVRSGVTSVQGLRIVKVSGEFAVHIELVHKKIVNLLPGEAARAGLTARRPRRLPRGHGVQEAKKPKKLTQKLKNCN